MTMAKGKQFASLTPLSSPSAGSMSPSTSLSALWRYMTPALDHIVRSSVNTNTAPPIAVEYHMGIHTNCYNYFTAQAESANSPLKKDNIVPLSGTDLYEQLDDYYSVTARELLLGAPEDDNTVIQYLITSFNRYNSGAKAANRILNYVNRHFVKRAANEDKGWLRLVDVLDVVVKTIREDDTREKISKRLKERRIEELKKWGYEDGGSAELMAQAEACAEAASSPDRIVPLSSLALRRFRTEFIEPLLKVPKLKGKGKKQRPPPPPPTHGDKGTMPKGRLARAVKELLETKPADSNEQRRLAMELADMLRVVGVRCDHPLRKKLDKFVIASAP